ACSLTAQVAQVVQLRTANVALEDNANLVDVRGVHWEGTLNSDTEGYLADGEGLADAAALTTDNDALEDLNTLGLTLDNLYVDLDGVTSAELRNVVAQVCCINLVKNVHGNLFLYFLHRQRTLAALSRRGTLGRFMPETGKAAYKDNLEIITHPL